MQILSTIGSTAGTSLGVALRIPFGQVCVEASSSDAVRDLAAVA
jgi:hypothetical protein